MDFKNVNISFGIMVLGMFVLNFALHADAHAPVDSPFCNGADVPPNLKTLCLRMVGGAKTWDEAASYSINRTLRKANRSTQPLLATIEKNLLPSMPISKRSQILDTCRNGYLDAIQNLQDSQSLIKNPPFSDLASKLTSAYTAFEDCRDAIVEDKSQPDIVEVTRFNNHIQRLIDVALIIAKQDPRAAEYNEQLSAGTFKDSQGDPSLIGSISSDSFGANNP